MKKRLFLSALCFLYCLQGEETTLLLVRHGETDWNAQGRAQGQTDNPLNAQGISQAKEVAKKLKSEHPNITHIYSSDLIRAHKTALETATLFNLNVTQKTALREINRGVLEGLLNSELATVYAEEIAGMSNYPTRKERWDHFPNCPDCETYSIVLDRVHRELTTIAKTHLGEKIAVFSHGRAINLFLAEISNKDDFPKLPNCAIAHVSYNPDNLQQPFTFLKIENPLQEGTSH